MKSGRPAVIVVSRSTKYALELKSELSAVGLAVVVLPDTQALAAVGISPSVVGIVCEADDKLLPFTEVLALARSYHVSAPLIALCRSPTIPLAVALIKAGAADVLESRVSALAAAKTIISLVQTPASKQTRPAATPVKKNTLTARETEILELVLNGHSSKDIGHRLGISRRTVDQHRSVVLKKLGARNAAELVRRTLGPRPHGR